MSTLPNKIEKKRIFSIVLEAVENIYRHRIESQELEEVYEGARFTMDDKFFTVTTENTINKEHQQLMEEKAKSILEEFKRVEKIINETTKKIREKINGDPLSDEAIKDIIIDHINASELTGKIINKIEVIGSVPNKIKQILDPILQREHFRLLEKEKLETETMGKKGGASQGFYNIAKNNGILKNYKFTLNKKTPGYSQVKLSIKIPRTLNQTNTFLQTFLQYFGNVVKKILDSK
jgi:hypothetical protein